MKKIEDILAVCIEDIRAGRTTVEECLTRYPAVRSQLEPLLRLAVNIHEPPAFSPSAGFKTRARVSLMDSIHAEQKREPWNIPFMFWIRHGWRSGWLKTSAIVLAVVLIISVSGTGTAYASQDSLPGDILYPVKIATENVRRVFTFDDTDRIELELAYAGTRLEEMGALVEKKPGEIASVVTRYEENITKAVECAERGRNRSRYSEGLEIVAGEASVYLSIIDDISDTITSTETELAEQASEVTLQMQFRVLGSLAVEDPVRSMEINVETMWNRLNRASNAANDGETSEVEKALGQLERIRQFGDEIINIARQFGHDTKAINGLNNQAVSEQLDIIKGMHGKVPDEMISPLEDTGKEQEGGHGKGTGGDSSKGPNNNIPATSDNTSQGAGDSPDEPAGSSDEPGMQPDDPGSPGESPGDSGNPPQSPVNPPENPGNGGSGSGKK